MEFNSSFGSIKREADYGADANNWGFGGSVPGPSARKRKRKSRWGAQDETQKTNIPGMPTTVPTGLTKDQEEMYLVQLQIEEISRRLRSGDLGIPPNPEDRSPSPEPIYNTEGKRLNTREYRTRKKLEEDRHNLIQKAMGINSDFKPPPDYKPPIVRVSDKVMIPQEEHPDINFVGLLIGPRGNTLKTLEKETGAKIIIRGKGSVKEGKIGRKDGQPLPGEDEPLHAYVTANNPDNVAKAVVKINEIIQQGIEVPEGQNDLRRQQLRELALLNGTLRENDALSKLKQIQQAQTIVTNTIMCTMCGGAGHIAQDCKERRPGDSFRTMHNQSAADRAKMDSEYMSLMAELGEGPPPTSKPAPVQPPSAGPPQRPPMGHQHMGGPPGWQPGPPHPPRGPPSLMSQGPHHGMPPPHHGMGGPRGPPSSVAPVPPPWQQSHSSGGAPANGGPGGYGAPPPPPPNTQSNSGSGAPPYPPWSSQSNQGMAPPPPPSSGAPPPWQTGGVGPVPPPPPNNMPPWQQQGGPAPVAPPPPPPSSYGGPPPPPPHTGSGDMPGIPLGYPPPPPPN